MEAGNGGTKEDPKWPRHYQDIGLAPATSALRAPQLGGLGTRSDSVTGYPAPLSLTWSLGARSKVTTQSEGVKPRVASDAIIAPDFLQNQAGCC